MTERSVTHATFCIERTLSASPARVFKAFAEQEAKDKWFTGPSHWVRTPRVDSPPNIRRVWRFVFKRQDAKGRVAQ